MVGYNKCRNWAWSAHRHVRWIRRQMSFRSVKPYALNSNITGTSCRKYVRLAMMGSHSTRVPVVVGGGPLMVMRMLNTTGNRLGLLAGTLRVSHMYCTCLHCNVHIDIRG